jgi:hypothetical protein
VDTANLLQAPVLAPPKWFASTDPNNQNQDFIPLKPGETRRVPLASGYLERLWSTALEPEKIEMRLQNGRDISLLRSGKPARGIVFKKAYTWYPDQFTPAPERVLRKDAALVVTNRSSNMNKWFYQVTVRERARADVPAVLTDKLSTLIRKTTIETGKTILLRADAGAKPLLVNSISVRPGKTDLATWSNLRLRVNRLQITSRKGDVLSSRAQANSLLVDVPLGALAGQFFEVRPHRDAMTDFDGQKLTLHWPMPFNGARDDIHIEVVNTGPPVEVEVEAKFATMDTPVDYHFHARYGSAQNSRKKPIRMLQLTGAGAFVGLQLAITPTAESGRRAFAYLEGNETIVADGKSYEGTGTEDFFNSAWYFPDQPFDQPYAGMTYKNPLPPKVVSYRLMIPDAVPFTKSLVFDFEHGNGNNSTDLEFRWVAFWYQAVTGDVKIEDALATRNSASSTPAQNPPWVFRLIAALGAFLLVITVLALARVLRRK